jgi:release factor glutamine methyltransferase
VSVADALLAAVVHRLIVAGCVAAAEEAAEFVAAAPDEPTLEAWLCRREQGEPLAWITSTVLFCGQTLHVAPGVYVPRIQSEELARRAAALLPDHGRAADLCTGAGAVAAHLMTRVPTAAVIGIDVDVRAAACARRNGVPTAVADLAEPLRSHEGFDVVTAVAPYVPTGAIRLLPTDVQRYEPRLALDGGADGLDLVGRVIAAARRLLRPGGWLLIEVGGDQDEALAPTLAATGFDLVTPWWDDDGNLRGIACQATGSGIYTAPDGLAIGRACQAVALAPSSPKFGKTFSRRPWS